MLGEAPTEGPGPGHREHGNLLRPGLPPVCFLLTQVSLCGPLLPWSLTIWGHLTSDRHLSEPVFHL